MQKGYINETWMDEDHKGKKSNIFVGNEMNNKQRNKIYSPKDPKNQNNKL
jgi:hypothetical protein